METIEILIAAFKVLQVLDVYTTNKVINQGGVESNPIMAWIMSKLGKSWLVAKFGLSAAVAYFMYYYAYPDYPTMVTVAMTGLVAFYMWVVNHNWKIMKK